MKRQIVFYISSIIVLIVFTYTSCSSPFNQLPKEAAFHQIEIGKGTPLYMYLDSDYNPINTPIGINDPDPGKTALVVLDNPMAEGVMVLAETTSNGTTVSIINKKDNNVIYMFYQQGKNFPSSLIIETQGERVNGFFSGYDTQKERYSIAFEQGEENFVLNNVTMTKNVLDVYTNDSTLTGDQNTRLKNICTTLGVFASLNVAISSDEDNTTVFLGWDWFKKISLKSLITGILIGVAIVAFTVAVILAPPAAVAIVGATVVISGGGVGSAIAFGTGSAAVVAAIVINIVPGIFDDDNKKRDDSPPQTKTLFVTIQKVLDDNIYDLSKTVFYIEENNSIEFNIQFINFESSNIQYFFYDVVRKMFHISPYNSTSLKFELNDIIVADETYFFNSGYLPQQKEGIIKLKISRNGVSGGYDEGLIHFVLNFGENNQEYKFIVNKAEVFETPLTYYNGDSYLSRFCPIQLTLYSANAKEIVMP